MADEEGVRNQNSLVALATQYAAVRAKLGGSPKSLEDKERLQHHWKRFSDALKQQPAIDPVQMAQTMIDMKNARQIMVDCHNSDSARDKRHISIMNTQVQRYQDTMVKKFTALSAAPTNQAPIAVGNAAPSAKPPPPTSPRPLAAGERPPPPPGPPPMQKAAEPKPIIADNPPVTAKRGFFSNLVNRASDFMAEARRALSDFTLAVTGYFRPAPPPPPQNPGINTSANNDKMNIASEQNAPNNNGQANQATHSAYQKSPEPPVYGKIPTREQFAWEKTQPEYKEGVASGYVSLNAAAQSAIEEKSKEHGYANIPSMPDVPINSISAENDYIVQVEPLSRSASVASNMNQSNENDYAGIDDVVEQVAKAREIEAQNNRLNSTKDGVYSPIPAITEYTAMPSTSEQARANEILGSNPELPYGFIPAEEISEGARATNTTVTEAHEKSEPEDHSQKYKDFKKDWNSQRQKIAEAKKPDLSDDIQPSISHGNK